MRVLITGGTGFIGRPLTLGALRRGWEVVVLVRRPESAAARAIAARGARLVIGDITDDATFRAGLEVARPEVFFHNAGWYELGIPRRARRQMWATNVQATESALDLAAQTGVPRVVYTSSTTALGDTGGATADETYQRRSPPMSKYEQTKAEAHAIARRHQAAGEPVLIVCPAQVIGPGDHSAFGRMARLFARGVLPPLGWAPQGAFTYAHVEDVAEAILLAAERGGSNVLPGRGSDDAAPGHAHMVRCHRPPTAVRLAAPPCGAGHGQRCSPAASPGGAASLHLSRGRAKFLRLVPLPIQQGHRRAGSGFPSGCSGMDGDPSGRDRLPTHGLMFPGPPAPDNRIRYGAVTTRLSKWTSVASLSKVTAASAMSPDW